MFFPDPFVNPSIVGSLRDREVVCSTSDLKGSNFESCVWRAVSPHHPQEVPLAQFSLYVHKSGIIYSMWSTSIITIMYSCTSTHKTTRVYKKKILRTCHEHILHDNSIVPRQDLPREIPCSTDHIC